MTTEHKFVISSPTTAFEAARIAKIHLLAMQSNPLLHAQFPTPQSQSALQDFLAKDTLQKLTLLQTSSHHEEGIIVARVEANGEIVGFIRWDHPPSPPPMAVKKEDEGGKNEEGKSDKGEKKKLEEGEMTEIKGCRKGYLEDYARLASEAKGRSGFMEERCWHLTFVCVDPRYQGRGVGSGLTRRLLELVDEQDEKLPVYLESTVEAVPLYEKLGFQKVDGFEMEIPVRGRSGADENEDEGEGEKEGEEEKMTYREVCMVYWPKGAR